MVGWLVKRPMIVRSDSPTMMVVIYLCGTVYTRRDKLYCGRRAIDRTWQYHGGGRTVEGRWSGLQVSCPVLVLEQGWPLPRGARRASTVIRTCPRPCHRRSSLRNPVLSSHLLTSACFMVAQLGASCSSLAHSSPPARQPACPPGTGGYRCSARCKSSLVYQIRVLGPQGQSVTVQHTATGRALPSRVKRNPDIVLQSIGNLPESVSRISREARPNACPRTLGFPCSRPIRALRPFEMALSLWHDFQTPFNPQPPRPPKPTGICSARGGGGASRERQKEQDERSKCCRLYYNGSRSQNGPAFSFLALSNLAPPPTD